MPCEKKKRTELEKMPDLAYGEEVSDWDYYAHDLSPLGPWRPDEDE